MAKLLAEYKTEIDYIAYCPHKPEQKCNCRKPKTGLVEKIENNLGIIAKNCYLVGDKLSDLQLALNANCIPVLVRTGQGRQTITETKNISDYTSIICDNLNQFTEQYIENKF